MWLIAVNLENSSERVSTPVDSLPVRIGRKPESLTGEAVELLRIPWDDRLVSRNHCVASRDGEDLIVQRLPALTGRPRPNAFYSNVPARQRSPLDEPLRLTPGQSAAIGAQGHTALYWLRSPEELDVATREYLERVEEEKASYLKEKAGPNLQRYEEVEQLDEYSLRLQLKLLQRDLPEQVLSGWTTEEELFTRTAVFLESALPGQKGVAVAFLAVDDRLDGSVEYRLLNPDPHKRADFRPSRTLLAQLDLDDPNPGDIHLWTSETDMAAFRTQSSLGRQIDWVAALPVATLDRDATLYHDTDGLPVYLYVETRRASDVAAVGFIPFLRLIASLVASLLSARERQRIQDQMSAYFSPALREVMREGDQSALEPAMVDCTVMFADRRGHSRILETARTDEDILLQLRENQRVVGAITQKVFDHDGVITDFAGDGALALWGWPTWGESAKSHARRAVEAAEAIVRGLEKDATYEEEHGRVMSAVRIGVSTGRIAVGKTGPRQQWHISVFGSVANLGARLERIAKEFRVPIILSGETASRLGGRGAKRLLRKLCFIRPAGFERSYPIHELVLPRELGGSGASPGDVKTYEQALARFVETDWDGCESLLRQLPPEDAPAQWLLKKTRLFRKDPPDPGWEGDIVSLSK